MDSLQGFDLEAIARLQKRQEQVKQENANLSKEMPVTFQKDPREHGKRNYSKNYYTMDLKEAKSITTFTKERFHKRKLDQPKEELGDNCTCMKIEGHLEAVKWLLWPRSYSPSPGYLQLDDWNEHPFIWMHYISPCDGKMFSDEVLIHQYPLFWDITGVQRYFVGQFHCEEGLFYYQYPNLKLPSKHGRLLWKINAASKTQSLLYKKEFGISLETTLKKMCITEQQMDRLVVSDHLIRIKCLDKFKRETFFKLLLKILSFQTNLQFVSFENLSCERLEGVRLIQQLACFNADSLKYLFLWQFVDTFENPILINYSYIKGSGKFIPRPDTKQCFLRSLGELRNLRILALEYSYLADNSGAALLALIPIFKRPHFRLHLMCRSKHIPDRNDPSMGCGGNIIPDTAWRRAQFLCPNLYLSMVFFRIREYDDLRRFLTPSIPLCDIHMDMGIDIFIKQRQESDLSSFLRHLSYRYASSLVTLSIHQWRFETYPLRRILEIIPGLVRFQYVGRIESAGDIRRMLYFISTGVCRNLKQLKIQIQDDYKNREFWRASIKNITEEYDEVLKLYDIQLKLIVYKI